MRKNAGKEGYRSGGMQAKEGRRKGRKELKQGKEG